MRPSPANRAGGEDRQAAEEAQLHDAGLVEVEAGEALQGLVPRNEVFGLPFQHVDHIVQRHALAPAAALVARSSGPNVERIVVGSVWVSA